MLKSSFLKAMYDLTSILFLLNTSLNIIAFGEDKWLSHITKMTKIVIHVTTYLGGKGKISLNCINKDWL